MMYAINATKTATRTVTVTVIPTPTISSTEVTFSHSASEGVVPAFISVSPLISHLKMFNSILVYPVLLE